MPSGIGRKVRFCVLAAAMSSCLATIPAEPRLMGFAQGEYAPYARPGTGIITGQVYVRTPAGVVRYGSGSEVQLSPVTTYSSEWWTRAVVAGQVLQPPDERAGPFQRTVVADSTGHFTFTGLPAGEYYVVSSVPGELPGPYWSTHTGSRVGQRVRMVDGGNVEVVLDSVHDVTAMARAPGESRTGSPLASGTSSLPAVPIEPPPNPYVAPGERIGQMVVDDRRDTVEDMIRVGLIRRLEQGELGLVRVVVGERFNASAARRYYFQRLAGAYYNWAPPDQQVLIELWDGARKIGEYAGDTFFIGEAYRKPR